MQSSSQPPKPRRFDTTKRTRAGPKSYTPAVQKEDKNMNTITNSSPRRATKGPVAPSRARVGAQPRVPLYQPKAIAQKPSSAAFISVKPKPKSARMTAASQNAPSPVLPPLPSILPLDPNCNEPSLPCLCCDGRSPQDNSSMFNHNHNNNNTISIRQQLQLPAPPGLLLQKQEDMRVEEQLQLPEQPLLDHAASIAENKNESGELDPTNNAIKVDEEDDDDSSSGDIDIEEEEDPDNDDDEDDDTLVPSCCDCPPSLLDLSLSSSTSSSSTSISSCSDLDSDSADQSYSMCSSHDQDNLSFTLSPKGSSPQKAPCSQPPTRSPPALPRSHNPFYLSSHSASSPDEGYPSALESPDYLGIKEDSEMNKLSLLDFLESVGEFGKMERFSQVIQVARWDLEGEQHWDVLRDRIDHLDRLEKVNREVKLAYIAKLHEKGFDLSDLEEQDLSDIMDEMGNIDIPWKLYKNPSGKMQDSQEFSDAGVDLTAPSDCDDPLAPDSLTPSPIEAPPRPPVRHASVTSDLHTYINISRETTSMAVPTSPTPLSTFSLNTTSPTFTTFRCEKTSPVSPPSLPPLPVSKPVPYLTLYTAPSPTIPTPTPPIPPPRTRHLARKEAQRRAALQVDQEKTPVSLPPPTTRPPPLPPPPVINISSSSPPAIPPPPALPPPPSFHALDVEIRKLLMLAGLTQAELLKLSPELSGCVVGLEDQEDTEDFLSKFVDPYEYRIRDRDDEKDCDARFKVEEIKKKEETKESQRTTSFSEMARRRRRNTSYMSEPYYSTGLSNTYDSKADNYEMLHYAPQRPDSPPPPPPPRPLPPIPSFASPKVSTLSANSAQPERFDWLIAFTPESYSPSKASSFEIRKRPIETPKRQSSTDSSSSGSAPKVTTTFKEIRFRNKNSSPPTKVITAPEPDPTIITPDPDLLYNLRWRRDKTGGDGSQWEYTSQAQALFMQPPPALTSMAALQEMLQRAEEEARCPKLCPSQKIGSSVSDSSLWNIGREWEYEDFKMEEKKVEDEVEVRGQADGERTLELRTTVSSPPLSLAKSSLPYFLHSAESSHCPDFSNPFVDPRPHSPVGRQAPEKLYMGQWDSAVSPTCVDRHESNTERNFESLEDFGIDSICDYRDYEKRNIQLANKQIHEPKSSDAFSNSMCNFDSLYFSDSPQQNTPDTPICQTPYKNMDVVMKHSNNVGVTEKSLNISHKERASKDLPPLPTFYLYHPKNCPLHRGAPPRLSPIGALSPPHRSGVVPGAPQSGLSSPLFPRSHTLPALAAPLYYPNLYVPLPPRAPPLPLKLYQEQSHVATVRSVSFAGSVQREETWMDKDVKHPMRRLALSSQCLQEKRALVSAVSVAVEAILAQFSSSRTVVQKALSGDSTINPSLGRLVLQCLCPALHSLLTDGLKPHQSDLIAGRRPNSAWSLVQASARPGSKTQVLFNLQGRVGELPQLKQSKHRFNAFILGLLNTKHLDFWLSHLQTCSDVLETYYDPSSFMRLSLTVCQPQFEELLLVLQPLSLLTFNLDLLFQHHHLDPHSHSPEIPSPPCQEAGLQVTNKACQSKKPGEKYMESLSEVDFDSSESSNKSSSQYNSKTGDSQTDNSPSPLKDDVLETSPQLRWVQEKEIGALPPPVVEEDGIAQQAGQVIQQGWEVMMRWGGQLSQNLSGLSQAVKKEELKAEHLQAQSEFVPVSSGAQMPWGLERLFGAPKSLHSPTSHHAPTRRPSQWLAPGVTALTRMVSSSTAPMLKRVSEPLGETLPEPEKEVESMEMNDKPRPLRSVRTLCDHRGRGSELSFCKGEELLVLGGVDQDWIRCRRGNTEGLVPIGYTSLIM